ncbi:prolipoprotein diacylglyceryl transferase [Erysipelothrix sp. HDW6C]|uniref:prolipoprotein diacylglyceryl transferase n=1 Tax=Erysipelothrix sp. HDW6C TaxID=2714930 RepID=UPI001407A830|nr:prolipoprotein diacylglyceryl transferase [Erysipelothrix sp. HDW6C]QIK68874.1 prolipoprotein diacylglyceryl transferase [Erysipelothrix sp. HDW6C]
MIKFFPDMKTFIQIGSLSIAWYAVLIMTGALLAFYVSKKNLLKVGYKADNIDDIFMGALLFGFLGARIWYVLFFDLAVYLKEPSRIFAIWEGGLAIQGGLLAGALFCYFYMKKRRINFIQAADLIVPNILIAQAIGRWGNFMNQEAYGGIVSESFFNAFPTWFKEMMFIGGNYHHPTFFYESVANILGWVLIVLVLKRFSRVKRGDLTFAYLMWYGATRFFIEGLRTDSLYFFNIRIAQLMSVVFIVIGMIGYFGGFKKWIGSPKPIILWDFDGTIANTQTVIVESFKQIFAKHKPDYKLENVELLSFLGPPIEETFANHFGEANADAMVKEYREINKALHVEHVSPMDGAMDVLNTLKDEGYRMGIVSNKHTETVMLGVDLLKMNDYFEVILGVDQFSPAKPDPAGIDVALERMDADKGQVIYVGDTASDVVAGQRAGSFTIGYIFDKMRENELRESNPNRITDDLREILEILKEDHEWTITMM